MHREDVSISVSYYCKAFKHLAAWLRELEHGLQQSEVHKQPVEDRKMTLFTALLQAHAVPLNPQQTILAL